MSFGPEGLLPPRYNEILEDIEKDQRSTLSKPLSYQPESVIYQLNSVYARSSDQLAQLIEASFDTLNLNSAEGYHLDELAILRGVFRVPASPSFTLSQSAVLVAGSVIPSGTVFYSSTLNIEGFNPESVTGNPLNCYGAKVQTNSVTPSVDYGLNINGANYIYSVQVGDSIEDIHNAISALIDADSNKTFSYTEDVSGSGRAFQFTPDVGTTLSVSSLTIKMVITEVTVKFRVETSNTGPITIGAGLMDATLSPIFGLVSTSNEDAFVLGRDIESDVSLRERIEVGNVGGSTGTPDTIRSAILTNVPGVSTVTVTENLTEYPTDSDNRPHMSFEVLVIGGADSEVAQELWRVKGAAARTWSAQPPHAVVDSAGMPQLVFFSRPTPVDINVEVDYVQYGEEQVPIDREATMQQAILDYIGGLPIGKDIIAGRLFSPIYSSVDGIGDVIVRVERADSPGMVAGTVSIAASEYPRTSLASITITDLT